MDYPYSWGEKEAKITVTAAARARLEAIIAAPSMKQKHVWRGRVALLAAAGVGTMAIVRQVGKSKRAVWRWRERFVAEGVDGLLRDRPRSGRPPMVGPDQVRAVVERTVPPDATHWSTRSLARAVGLGKTTIQKIWREHGLKPHLIKGFKVSREPAFVDKVRDVVGLYINPPDHALSVDEKSQIQALKRTQQPLPLIAGHAATRTHDYTRHDDPVRRARRLLGQCSRRHQEFVRFLDKIDRDTPAHLEVHPIADNYATHKHAAVRRWLERHPRFHTHFSPTSWLNMVERLFADLTCRRLRRGCFRSVAELKSAIRRYLNDRNAAPKPFVWTKGADTIIRKYERAKRNLISRAGH